MATGSQLRSAVKTLIEENVDLDDALEDKHDTRATVRAMEVFKQFSALEGQIARAGDTALDSDLRMAQVLLLSFRAALLRSIAVGGLNSDNHIWEREARTEHVPRAIEAYQKILAFSNGDYVIADTLYQLGWLQRARGDREAAFRYFREITTRFPDDPNFGARATLRIVELEGEQAKTGRSGFTLRFPAGRSVSCAQTVTLDALHFPLRCAACSIQWLMGKMGRVVSSWRIDGALGSRFLPRSSRIGPALASLGMFVSYDLASAIEAGVDLGVILVSRRITLSVDHVTALHRSGGTWSLFDPGNLISQLHMDVSPGQVRDLMSGARLVIGVS